MRDRYPAAALSAGILDQTQARSPSEIRVSHRDGLLARYKITLDASRGHVFLE